MQLCAIFRIMLSVQLELTVILWNYMTASSIGGKRGRSGSGSGNERDGGEIDKGGGIAGEDRDGTGVTNIAQSWS